MKTEELYAKVTNTIIELLEKVEITEGNFYWNNIQKSRPKNIFKDTTYTGINYLYLSVVAMVRKYPTNFWLTFKDIQQLQGKIKKGSRAAEVIFYKTTLFDENGNPTTDSEKAKTRKRIVKYYNVFNVADVEGLPEAYYSDEKIKETVFNQWQQDERAEQIINGTGAKIQYLPQNRAFYRQSDDTITLPIREQFTGVQPFYSTCFHELIHWTGHPSRLNREKGGRFGDEKYAFEELVAELGASFLCTHLDFSEYITENAIYIKSWLSALKNDTQFIFKASAQAQKAADFILKSAEIRSTAAA